jgi:phosphonate transport system substrate-binding protein
MAPSTNKMTILNNQNCIPLTQKSPVSRSRFGGKSFWLWLSLFVFLLPAEVGAQQDAQPIRMGITPAIVHDQYELLIKWRLYLQEKLGQPVEFVSRDSYRDTIDLLKRKKLDFAWVSDYPYVYLEHNHFARLLVTPVYRGRPYYRAYFIVPASDLNTKSLLQLKGKVFAYADLYSFTGYVIPRYQLQQAGEDPTLFFRKTFFTWGHRKVIEAVSHGLADGGMVDSFVWDSLSVLRKDLTDQTRIVSKTQEFGFPPIVALDSLDKGKYTAMQRVLIEMANDPDGAKLLKQLQLDRFGPPAPELYREVNKMMQAVGDL